MRLFPMPLSPLRTLTILSVAAAGLVGCAGDDPAQPSDVIAVAATDTTCDVARTQAPTGTVTFEFTNKGSLVNEFYVYADGDRIIGEVENVGPGLSRTFHVQIAQPGTYETACKPGMVGDGIRAPFTVTGSSAAPITDDAALTGAVSEYTQYVRSQGEEFLEETTDFVALVKAGKVDQAKAAYPQARSYWERIEPVAESFGDLDPKIDGREDVIEEGMAFTGYHRLERDLWQDGLQPDTSAIADQLLADVTTLIEQVRTVKLNPLQLANGSKALLDEIATGKITGEEERYSHTDLWDFNANFEGSMAAIAALKPYLSGKDSTLVADLDRRSGELRALLDSHREGEGFVSYTALTPANIKALTVALDAFSEEVAKVAGVVAAA